MRLPFAGFVLSLMAFAVHSQPRDPGDAIAVVLGQEITVEDATGSPITSLIGDPLTKKFAEDNGIQPTADELAAFAERMLEMQRREVSRLKGEQAKLEQDLEGTHSGTHTGNLSAAEREEIQNRLDIVVATID